MGQDIPPPPLSLYIHIPFCLSRCGYCSFFSLPYSRDALDNYTHYIREELSLYSDQLQQPLGTLYFGGGSPSLLTPQQIQDITAGLSFIPTTEITLEVNPIQITPSFLDGLRKTPVNRLSIGLQSMTNIELTWLDRKHRAEDIPGIVRLCRDYGYDNISLDLIYGLPMQVVNSPKLAMDAIKRNLDSYLSLHPEHLSCYLLTLDSDSARGSANAQSNINKYTLPDDSLAARQYTLIRKTLVGTGFQHYEISNFALPGKASRHNLAYWQSHNYLACGASGAGWISPIRYQNHSDLSKYYEGVAAGQRFLNSEACPPNRIEQDCLMMGLRLLKGIDKQDFRHRFGTDFDQKYGNRVIRLKSLGMLKSTTRRVALTAKALFLSNAVIAELIL